MRNFVTIDDSNFPIVVGKYHNFVPTPEEFVKAQKDCERYYIEHSNFVVLVDLSELHHLPMEFRISQAKWSQRNRSLLIRQNIKFSFCTPTVMQQLLIKTVFAVSTPGVHYYVTTHMEKAEAWATKQLAAMRSLI